MSIRVGRGEAVGERSFRGTWHKPEEGSARASGILTVGGGSAPILDLNGAVGDEYPGRAKVLLGRAHDGTKLSLVEAFRSTREGSNRLSADAHEDGPEVLREVWDGWAVAVGAHLPDGQQTQVTELRFQSRMLDAWTEWTRPRFKPVREKGIVGGTVTIPEPVSAEFALGRVSFEWETLGSSFTSVSADWQVYPVVRIEFAAPTTIEASWGSVVVPLLQLFSLCVGSGDSVKQLRYTLAGASPDDHEAGRDALGGPFWAGQFEWLTSSWMAQAKDRELPHHFEHLVQASETDISQLLERWFGIHERFKGVLLEYSSISMWPDMTIDESFLRIVRALEVVHGVIDPTPKIPSDEFKAVRAKIKQALVDDPHRDFIMVRLKHADEPSLRERLLSLFDRAEITPERRLGQPLEEFVKNVVRTRDAMTHTGEPGPLSHDLHRPFLLLDLLMRETLLLELGYDAAQADEFAFRTRDARLILFPA